VQKSPDVGSDFVAVSEVKSDAVSEMKSDDDFEVLSDPESVESVFDESVEAESVISDVISVVSDAR